MAMMLFKLATTESGVEPQHGPKIGLRLMHVCNYDVRVYSI